MAYICHARNGLGDNMGYFYDEHNVLGKQFELETTMDDLMVLVDQTLGVKDDVYKTLEITMAIFKTSISQQIKNILDSVYEPE